MADETRRVIWRHPRGIYETVEVSKNATHAAWHAKKSSLHRRTAADRPEVRAYR